MKNPFHTLSKFAYKNSLPIQKTRLCQQSQRRWNSEAPEQLSLKVVAVFHTCVCLRKLWKCACKKRDAAHAVEPLVVDCVLIYFKPTPGFSGRCCRCLKLNKAINVSAVMLCLRSVDGLTPRRCLSHGLSQQLWFLFYNQICICLYFASEFFPSQIILQSLMSIVEMGQDKFSRMQVKASRGRFHLSLLYLISQTIKYCWSQVIVAQVSSFSVWAWRTAEYLAEQLFPRRIRACGVARCGVTFTLQHGHFQSHKHARECERPHISPACIREGSAFSLLLFMSWQSNTTENPAMIHIYSAII